MTTVITGAALPRQDGAVKVTGAARYANDHHAEQMLYGVLVGAPAPAGRLRAIDTTAAAAVPGVVRALTYADFPRLSPAPAPPYFSERLPLQDDEIRHEGEPIALVLAETLEDAEYAASLVRADVDPADFIPHPAGARDRATTPRQSSYLFFGFTDFEHGDVEAALEQAPVVHEATYVQPSRHHNPMEPSATLAQWHGDELEVIDATQHVYGVQAVMAAAFEIPPERIRVRSPHTGGGFGCKGFVWPHQIAAAAAARIVGRPVRIALSRAQMYNVITYQPQIVQTVRLGADSDGRLRAIDHESINVTSVTDDFVEYATEASRSTYAADAIRVSQRVQRANVNLPNPMRAPVEGCGLWALGSAMNELAEKLQVDPIEVRLASYAEVHPVTGQPWSSKKLRECYEQGAAAIGWRRRPSEPERDGHWLVGQGMADCAMGCFRNQSQAHVRINADGSATVLSGFQDIGTGTLTIFPQIAGAVLGLEPGLVRCEMGDTALPEAGPTYGSSSTMGVGAAVMAAARDAIARLEQLSGSRLGETPGAGALAAAMASAGLEQLIGEGSWAPDQDGQYALHTFGAVFVEVGVDQELGLVRLRRAVGRYSAGRIVNERTARAQMIGGIVWGWGKATMEASRQDPERGRWLSKNLAGVALPVNADIPADIDVAFVEEVDEHASPIGGKGIGELGATGIDAAVADAVFHSTGRRIRELPITPDKLVGVGTTPFT
jgi:xanthine dehydrogenase YagR molybdenum-binding subunit